MLFSDIVLGIGPSVLMKIPLINEEDARVIGDCDD